MIKNIGFNNKKKKMVPHQPRHKKNKSIFKWSKKWTDLKINCTRNTCGGQLEKNWLLTIWYKMAWQLLRRTYSEPPLFWFKIINTSHSNTSRLKVKFFRQKSVLYNPPPLRQATYIYARHATSYFKCPKTSAVALSQI